MEKRDLEKNLKKRKQHASQAGITKMTTKKKRGESQNERSIANESEELTAENTVPAPSIPQNIFQYFKELTNESEEQRVLSAFQLIDHLKRIENDDKRKNELGYTLKRLIRGCGASSNTSRAGFFMCLVGILKELQADVSVLETNIFDIVNKELHVGGTIANKEDADAFVGRVLVCEALLRSNGVTTETDDESLKQICDTLLQSSRQRSYHSSLAYAVLIELFAKVSVNQFKNAVWPLLQIELTKAWSKQTLHTVHCLMVASSRFPNIVNKKYLKANFGDAEILNSESYEHLYRIFWRNSNTQILTHPAFEVFGSYLASCRNLCAFWTDVVSPKLQASNKVIECETLKIFTDILQNVNPEEAGVAAKIAVLLSENFMNMLVQGLKNIKQKKDESLKAFYDDFLEALANCFAKLPKQCDAEKVRIIRRLILPPGIFNLEKYTGTRIVHKMINSLGVEGLKEVFQLYKGIFVGVLAKSTDNSGETWLHFERMNAGYMLQHLLLNKTLMQAEVYDWRAEQMLFLLASGTLFVQVTPEASFKVCKKQTADQFCQEFGDQCKSMFFASLLCKLVDMEAERKLLFSCVQLLHKYINDTEHLRVENVDESFTNAWQNMYNAVNPSASKGERKKSMEKNKKQTLVFQILLMNMGLQLFREPEMAVAAVNDLIKCIERANKGLCKSNKAGKLNGSSHDDEPEWIEVVVDLFLHLLSQNASALRNCVNSIFPHLSGNLNLSSIHQILSMLDMKDGNNPLSLRGDDASEEGSDDEGGDDSEGENSETSEDDSEDAHDSENSNEDEDGIDDDDDDQDESEDVTATDRLRNAISQALMENNAALNAADDDMASVDLNDITEEEGQRLDEALAKAFKVMRRSGPAETENKKSKRYRTQTTTVMHFRVRVLDLLEIYLQQPAPIPLLIVVEIMLSVYNMLEHCVVEELEPLRSKVEKVLHKLCTLKTYTNEVADLMVDEENMADYVRLIVEKKANVVIFDLANSLKNRCVIFLLQAVGSLRTSKVEPEKIVSLLLEYQNDFLQSRNPTLNVTALSEIYKLRFAYVWRLAAALVQNGMTAQTRTFRRIQIYEVLRVLYKNNELQRIDADVTSKSFAKIEKLLLRHIEYLASHCSTGSEDTKLSSKEFQMLLEFLLDVHRAHSRLDTASLVLNSHSFELIQSMRRKMIVQSSLLHIYQRFCNVFKLPVVRSNEITRTETHVMSDGKDVAPERFKSKRKRLNSINNSNKVESSNDASKASKSQQEKKAKKARRMLAASKGLNGAFGGFGNSIEDSQKNGFEVH